MSTKIEKLEGFKSFNLPAKKTCIGKTVQCVKYCYALKGRFLGKHVQRMYEENYQASKCIEFIHMIQSQLNYSDRVVRIHGSGDFYNNEYFGKWVAIAISRPHIIFYTYTRNYNLDLSDLPDNLIVYYSMDDSTKRINETAVRFAKVINGDKKNTEHLETYKDGVICTSDNCASCGYCFNEAKNVYFIQKYKKYQVELPTV